VAKNRGERDDDAERESEEIADEVEDVDDEEYEDLEDDDEDSADAELDPEKETVPPRRKSRGAASSTSARATSRGKATREEKRPGLIRRLGIFVREVFAELQKVIWPTRRELLTYTTVVVIFVAIMMTYVGLLDLGFAKSLFWVFGGAPTETPTTP
jgi:preprotein translocase subunit SecE